MNFIDLLSRNSRELDDQIKIRQREPLAEITIEAYFPFKSMRWREIGVILGVWPQECDNFLPRFN